ncbi:unnamed protein product [Hymenolepis diminuta]|uniref:Uncharacterized protein n=1 Tax=Hymenolepis diminuta TaxID=6216 RepID=A0A3P6W1G8_HYMDI|nr:unnamed protein product [Hymenolepis diminuta]
MNLCIVVSNISLFTRQKTSKPQSAENLQKDLLKSKARLCEFLKSEIARNQGLLNGKIDVMQFDEQLKTSDEADRQLRLKVLRFGLDERRKKIQDAKNEADSLASKLDSMKIETFQKKLTAITEMYSTLEFQQKILHNSRNRVKSMREELTEIKLTFHGEREETVDERQNVDILLTQINGVKSEIQELDSKPVLLKLNLEKSILAMSRFYEANISVIYIFIYLFIDHFRESKKAAIEKVGRDSALIKSRIRRRCKQLKTLQPVGSEANKHNSLCTSNLTQSLCCEITRKEYFIYDILLFVPNRLEFAENLDRRTQDVLSRQELRVENAKMKFNRVKELYAEEKRAQLLRLSELETEKEEYVQRLMCLNKKLDRLGRQNLLKGTQGAYKWIMASFDIPDYECEDEIDEYVSKRCAFICQEIKRLQQYSAWLEENLKAAEMKSLNRQKMSAIKAVLDKGGLQNGATDVRRRNQNRMNRPRPISMIETVTKKIVRSATMRAKVAPAQVDARRRTMVISRPTLSQEEPTISATQRRLVYSQSLRERGINPRMPLSQLQRGTSGNSVSLSFRSPTPLIYTAFRNSKHTTSSSRVLGFDS